MESERAATAVKNAPPVCPVCGATLLLYAVDDTERMAAYCCPVDKDHLTQHWKTLTARQTQDAAPFANADVPLSDDEVNDISARLTGLSQGEVTKYDAGRLVLTIRHDRRERDEQTRGAYYKGRDRGKHDERDKRERMIEAYIERARHWKERAKTAEGQLKANVGAAPIGHVVTLTPFQQLRRIASGTGYSMSPTQFDELIRLLRTRVDDYVGFSISGKTHNDPPMPPEAPSRDRRGAEIRPRLSRSDQDLIEGLLMKLAFGRQPDIKALGSAVFHRVWQQWRRVTGYPYLQDWFPAE